MAVETLEKTATPSKTRLPAYFQRLTDYFRGQTDSPPCIVSTEEERVFWGCRDGCEACIPDKLRNIFYGQFEIGGTREGNSLWLGVRGENDFLGFVQGIAEENGSLNENAPIAIEWPVLVKSPNVFGGRSAIQRTVLSPQFTISPYQVYSIGNESIVGVNVASVDVLLGFFYQVINRGKVKFFNPDTELISRAKSRHEDPINMSLESELDY